MPRSHPRLGGVAQRAAGKGAAPRPLRPGNDGGTLLRVFRQTIQSRWSASIAHPPGSLDKAPET